MGELWVSTSTAPEAQPCELLLAGKAESHPYDIEAVRTRRDAAGWVIWPWRRIGRTNPGGRDHDAQQVHGLRRVDSRCGCLPTGTMISIVVDASR